MNSYSLLVYLSSLLVAATLGLYYYFARKKNDIDNSALKWQFSYMIFYFALAPAMHSAFDVFINVYVESKDLALFRLNVVNFLGVMLAMIGFSLKPKLSKQHVAGEVFWKKIKNISIIFVGLGVLNYALIWIYFGENILKGSPGADAQDLSIAYYLLIESVPTLLGWYLIANRVIKKKKYSSADFYIALTILGVSAVLFSGLRGSRVSIAFQIISFIILYALLIRKISFKEIVLIIISGVAFNNVYSIYKYSGFEQLQDYVSTGEKKAYVKPINFILQDLGRSDVQAVVLDRVSSNSYVPPYFPHTYLYGLQLALPDVVRLDSVRSKSDLGTEIQFGKFFEDYTSTRIYAMTGEAALNFGFYSLPFVFLLFGFAHRQTLSLALSFRSSSRILFYPLLVFIPIYILFYDFDNIIFLLIKTWLFPWIAFTLARVRIGVSHQ